MADGLSFSRRLRRTPYTASAERAGVSEFSVVNHMLLPKSYGRSVEETTGTCENTSRSGMSLANARFKSGVRMRRGWCNG